MDGDLRAANSRVAAPLQQLQRDLFNGTIVAENDSMRVSRHDGTCSDDTTGSLTVIGETASNGTGLFAVPDDRIARQCIVHLAAEVAVVRFVSD